MVFHKGKTELLFAAVVFVYLCAAVRTEALTIAEDGVAKAVIIVAPKASEPERHAAVELAKFLQQITGGKFETAYGFVSGKSRILVGLKAAKLAIPNFSRNGLGSDGIVIRTIGNDLILAGDVVSKKKPDPEIYNLALRRLDLKPNECVVIEDSRNGFLAAKTAGIYCVITTNSYTKEEDFTEADVVVSELGDLPNVQINLETIKNIVAKD